MIVVNTFNNHQLIISHRDVGLIRQGFRKVFLLSLLISVGQG